MKSRFTKYFEFKDWSAKHSTENLLKFAEKEGFDVEVDVSKFSEKIGKLIALPGWANGRDVNQIWKDIKKYRSSRVVNNPETVRSIKFEEINKALDVMLKARIAPSESKAKSPMNQDYSNCLKMDIPFAINVQTEKVKEQILEKGDDTNEPIKNAVLPGSDDGKWNGMDVERELRPLNDLLESLKWISDEKINDLIDSGPDSDNANTLVQELVKKGLDKTTARNIVNKWIDASEVQRKKRYDAEVQAKLLSRRPIIQCQVCKSTGNYWSPCPVAPMQIGWEDVEIPSFQARSAV